jgi:PPOX class probable F420-dependent enzyme
MARTIATTSEVDRDALLDFVRPRHHLVLVTTRRDGTPQASPVTGGVDADGRFVIASYPERAKARNARRHPEVSVLVLPDDVDGAWVQADGTCEVLDVADSPEAPHVLDAFVDYYRCIAGEHPDWDDYRRAMLDQRKCLLRITPTRWGPVATGGLPADRA